MESLQYFLPQVWFAILGLFLFLYVMLDGFDLGVGILSITAVFMIVFIGFLIPIMLAYNIYNYIVFRGKIANGHLD